MFPTKALTLKILKWNERREKQSEKHAGFVNICHLPFPARKSFLPRSNKVHENVFVIELKLQTSFLLSHGNLTEPWALITCWMFVMLKLQLNLSIFKWLEKLRYLKALKLFHAGFRSGNIYERKSSVANTKVEKEKLFILFYIGNWHCRAFPIEDKSGLKSWTD